MDKFQLKTTNMGKFKARNYKTKLQLLHNSFLQKRLNFSGLTQAFQKQLESTKYGNDAERFKVFKVVIS